MMRKNAKWLPVGTIDRIFFVIFGKKRDSLIDEQK